VSLPRDRITTSHQGFGFVEFKVEDDAEYAVKVMNLIKLYHKPIRVNKSSTDKKTMDVSIQLLLLI
jgi:splicing factor 3B subunit 4